MTENFKLVNIYCDMGKTIATVMVPENEEIRDNTRSHVTSICKGCHRWSLDKIDDNKSDLEDEYGTGNSGIKKQRKHLLEQHWVDQARLIRNVESEIVIAYCTAIGAE